MECVQYSAYALYKCDKGQCSSNKKGIREIAKRARFVELSLYHNASSVSEYLDVKTLSKRIASANNNVETNREDRIHLTLDIVTSNLWSLQLLR